MPDSTALASHKAELGGTFEADAQPVLARLGAAVKHLVESAPVNIQKAADLHRALDVRPSLGWEIYKLATAENPLGSVTYVPKPEPMGKVLKAAHEKGFKPDAINAVASAYAEFCTLVEHHAPDRATFDAMVSGLSPDNAPAQVDLKQRRTAFQANSQIWGFHSRTVYGCAIWNAGPTPDTQDIIAISGRVGLQQLRPLPVIPLSTLGVVVIRGVHPGEGYRSTFGEEILEEFCSQPMPALEIVQEGGNWREVVQLKGVGKGHELTCFFSQGSRVVVEHPGWGNARILTGPAERQVLDLLLPRGWAVPESVSLATYGNPADMMVSIHQTDSYRMPFKEKPEYLGTFLDKLADPDIPRCPEMVRSVLLKQGWQNTVFDIFRCCIRYPVLHAMNILRVDGAGVGSPSVIPPSVANE